MPRKVILAANFPDNDDEFIAFCNSAITCLTNCSKLLPALPAGVANLTTLLQNLQGAQATAKNGGRGTATIRNSARDKMEIALRQDETYAEAVIAQLAPEDQDAAIAQTVFSRKKPSTHTKKDYTVARGATSDSAVIDLKAQGRHGTVQYCHQYSINNKQSWVDVPPTLDTRITVTGLPVGTLVYFRYRTLIKGVYSDWSQELSYLVH